MILLEFTMPTTTRVVGRRKENGGEGTPKAGEPCSAIEAYFSSLFFLFLSLPQLFLFIPLYHYSMDALKSIARVYVGEISVVVLVILASLDAPRFPLPQWMIWGGHSSSQLSQLSLSL